MHGVYLCSWLGLQCIYLGSKPRPQVMVVSGPKDSCGHNDTLLTDVLRQLGRGGQSMIHRKHVVAAHG